MGFLGAETGGLWRCRVSALSLPQGLVHKPQQQQQQLKQQLNMVPREPAFSLASASEVSAFLAGPARFLASEALQGPELQLQRLLLQRRPNTELPEA